MKEPQQAESRVLSTGLWGMTKPIFIERLVIFIIPMTDTFFLSRISDTAAGAVGILAPLLMIFSGVLHALSVGGSNVSGRHIGAGNYKKANRSLAVFFLLIVSAGIGVGLIMFAAAPALTALLSMPAEAGILAVDYMKVMALFVALMAPYLFSHSVLVMYGRPKWVLHGSVLMLSTNIALNTVVVYGLFGIPKMGVAGVAFASVIAAILRLALMIYFLHGRLRVYIPYGAAVRFFSRLSPPIIRLGVPSFFEPCSFFLSLVIVNSFIAKLGVEAMAARVYTVNSFIICFIVSMATAVATQAIIAQLIGRRDFERVHAQFLQGVKAVIGVVAGVSVFVLLMRGPILHLLTDNAAVIELGSVLFIVAALTEPARAVNVLTTFALRATGDVWFITVAAIAIVWLVVVPVAYFAVFELHWGVIGVSVVLMADEYTRASINIRRWFGRRWQYRWSGQPLKTAWKAAS